MASAVLVLLGGWVIFDLFSRASFVTAGASLYSLRNLFEGLLFVLTGASNLLAVKAYPERNTTLPSLCCGALACAAGLLWVWLAMHPGAHSERLRACAPGAEELRPEALLLR